MPLYLPFDGVSGVLIRFFILGHAAVIFHANQIESGIVIDGATLNIAFLFENVVNGKDFRQFDEGFFYPEIVECILSVQLNMKG